MNLLNWHEMQPGLRARAAFNAKRIVAPIPKLDRLKEQKVLFIHVPKNAGTSIARMFFGWEPHGHYKWWFYYYYFGARSYEDMFSFAFCRNPFSRLVSAYLYLKNGGNNLLDLQFCKKYLSDCTTLSQFVLKMEKIPAMQTWVHFQPQHEFIFDNKGCLMVSHLARFEQFSEEVQFLAGRLGKSVTVTHEKKGGVSDLLPFYDSDRVIQVVTRLYRKDFELLGYDTRL